MARNTNIDNRQFFKTDYYRALEYIVPKYFLYDDQANYEKEIDLKDQIINCHIDLAKNINSVLDISSIAGTYYSSLDTLSGISDFFIKQNEISDITPTLFQDKILDRFEKTYKDFNDYTYFKNFIDETLLPSIYLNNPTKAFMKDDLTSSSAHIYLIENLSWLYFLNVSSVGFSPSSLVSDLLTSTVYFGKTIHLNDCLKVLSEYLWINNLTSYYPSSFASSTGKYTSGTQQLDKLKTWIDVIYSPLFADKEDFYVFNAFENVIKYNLKNNNEILNGPFFRLLRLLSFGAYDTDNKVEELKALNNIQECPDEYLPYLASLIGWKLLGSNTDRWRLQIRNAIEIYKKAGTKKSITTVFDTLFPKNIFDIESNLSELWESYVPYLIYYSLATESPYFRTKEDWTSDIAVLLDVSGYSSSSLDENIRLATDKIIYDLFTFPSLSGSFSASGATRWGGDVWSELEPLRFFYRNREYPVPPFEEYPYYVDIELNQDMIDVIVDRLVCFGVRRAFADQVGQYIKENTLDKDDQPKYNSWLFFTSGYNTPPNINEIVGNLGARKFEYVPLWSGKSSHFKVDLQASSFDFNNRDFETQSGEAVRLVAESVNEFSPAHSIPLISLSLSTIDYLSYAQDVLPLIVLDKSEIGEEFKPIINYGTSALYVSSYKRSSSFGNGFVGSGSGKYIGREALYSPETPELSSATYINNVARNSLRRRNYEKVAITNGYYDRTGFNMPIAYDGSYNEPRLPLGLIPSSMKFQSISDYNNLPDVYSKCNDLGSSASYYGYSVSNTLPARAGRNSAGQKNLVIFAGQSNINGAGSGEKDIVFDVNYWDLNTSSFIDYIAPRQNTTVQAYPGETSAPKFISGHWGVEVKFAELLKQYNQSESVYILKFAVDNSTVIERTDSTPYLNWCPSTVTPNSIYNKFNSTIDLAISALGGFKDINSISLIWGQGETEAGMGQNNDASALQFSAATKYFLDTFKNKFPDYIKVDIFRTKIHEDLGLGSQSDWLYYPYGKLRLDTLGGDCTAEQIQIFASAVSSVSATGHYGIWSWSSINTVRSQQEALDQDDYGQLISLDDMDIYEVGVGYRFEGPFASDAPSSVWYPLESTCLSSFTISSSFNHYNIHYVDDIIDKIGERLFIIWAEETEIVTNSTLRDVHVDRGQLSDIHALVHRLIEKQKYYLASATMPVPTSSIPLMRYLNSFRWKDVYTSYANSATEFYGWSPSSVDDYNNFKLGNKLHKLYQIYTKEFDRHKLAEDMHYRDGANIFSHTYGPILYNNDFDIISDSNLINTSVSSNIKINTANGLKPDLSYPGTFIESSSYIYPFKNDIVNSSILSGIDIIIPSGMLTTSYFSIFRIPSTEKPSWASDFMYDRTFLKIKNYSPGFRGFPRVRFDITRPQMPSNLGYPIQTNFLLPEHQYKIKIKSLISSDDGASFMNGIIAVWIHTKPELEKMWTYTKNNTWIQHDVKFNSNNDYFPNGWGPNFARMLEFFHLYSPTYKDRGIRDRENTLRCIDILKQDIDPLLTFKESDFNGFEINFNTFNNFIYDRDYGITYGQVHRKNQKYVVEVMLISNNLINGSMLLDKVEIIDMTMNEMAIVPSLIDICPSIVFQLTKEELQYMFRYWNTISGKNYKTGLASRDAYETSGVMYSQGGSRLDYRIHTNWVPTVDEANKYILNSNMIDTIMVPVC